MIAGLSLVDIDFGNQTVGTASASRSVMVRNVSSTTTVTISPPALNGNGSGDYVIRSLCGSSIGPDSSCPIEIQFTPTKKGARRASLTIIHNSAGSALTLELSGLGK